MHICILPFPDITDVENHFQHLLILHIYMLLHISVSACNHMNFGFQDDRKNHILIKIESIGTLMHLALKSRQEHFKRLCFLLFYGTHTSCGVYTWLNLSMEFLLNFITLNTLLLYKFYLQWVINIWTITVHMFFITADVVITRESCSSPYHCAIHKDYIVFSPFKFTYMVEKQEKKFMWIFLIILFFFGGGGNFSHCMFLNNH